MVQIGWSKDKQAAIMADGAGLFSFIIFKKELCRPASAPQSKAGLKGEGWERMHWTIL